MANYILNYSGQQINEILGRDIPKVYYGVVNTSSAWGNTGGIQYTTTINNFTLEEGAIIFLKFSEAPPSSYSVMGLNINDSGTKLITNSSQFRWNNQENILPVIYNGTNYSTLMGLLSNSSKSGDVKTETSATSTATEGTALTPAALNNFIQNFILNAPIYGSHNSYQVGDIVRHEYNAYVCKEVVNVGSSFNSSQWTQIPTIQDQLNSKADKSTTLAGYGITDAKITDQTITLGNKSIDVGLGNAAIYSGVCHTAAATAQKDVVCTSYIRTGDPEKGDIIFVTFDNTNNASTDNLTLKVNNSTAKHIQYQSTSSIEDLPIVGLFMANNTYRFQYNGTSWIAMLNYDTNTNTQQRTYAESGNVEYPIAGVGDGTTSTSPLNITSSYKSCYAVVPSLAANKATINTSTGKITIPGGIQIGTSKTSFMTDTAQIYGTATIDNINVQESIMPINKGCILGDEGWEWDTIYSNNYVGSAQLTGTPTAPTAPAGTNTTQIATTAFVQKAIKPVIIISVSDLPAGTKLVVTLTLQDDDMPYSLSAAVDANGITTMLLEYTGTYAITYNNNKIKSKKTIDITVPTVYTLSAIYFEPIVYTVQIDKTNSNPKTACTYADNAENMIKGSAEWDNMPIFKHIRPCVFLNGEVNYYLDPNDWTKKYGTNETSVLTGEDGDVMIEFPKFAYKIKTVDNIITVSVTNDESVVENDSEYTYDAFSRLTEGDVDYFYKGAFKGSLDSGGQLRSIVGTKPAANKTIGQFRAAAQSNGAHYQQSTYAQLKALQCLYLIKYGDINGQAEVGNGVVSASGSYVSGYNTTDVASIAPELSTLASGMTFGTTANNTTHMRLFGIEDFWGCIWECVDGLTTDGERNVITSWNSFSGEGVESTSVTTPSGLASNANGYIRDVIGNNAAGFMPNNFSGGSSSTHWSDSGRLYASCVLLFGGAWSHGDQAGPFYLFAGVGVSYASANVGARLSFV